MLLKKPGNYQINRLQVIHIYKHNYNLILALKWHALIQHSVQNNLLHQSQYGRIPGRTSVQPTLIKELQNKICCTSRRPLVHLDYSTASCYDRITLNMASIISRSYGLHRNITMINATTLQKAKYVLKTQLGASQCSYSHTPERPLYRIGQGMGNSPVVWALLSSTMFSLYSSHAHRAHFYDPSKILHSQVDMVGFVDDTSGSINVFLSPKLQEPEYCINLTTHDAQLWNNILSLSSGALQAAKCSYHLLYFDFTSVGILCIRGITFLLRYKSNSTKLPHPLRCRTLQPTQLTKH